MNTLHEHITLIKPLRSLHVLFSNCSLQSKECLNIKNLLQRKLDKFLREYPDEFSTTPASDLLCNFCNVLVKCDKKVFFVETHQKSKQQQGKWETKSKSQSEQTFFQLDQVNFKKQIVLHFQLQISHFINRTIRF